MGVIIIIAVFWLLGLLTAWSMCVVAARADRRMEENRHARQRLVFDSSKSKILQAKNGRTNGKDRREFFSVSYWK